MPSCMMCSSEGKLSAILEHDKPDSVSSAPAGTWDSILTLLDVLNYSLLNYSSTICLPSIPKLGGEQ